ncbi:MAG: hypothetical protein IPP72_09130 [Chitinophagaceae bacterium]|nr:hypothetical protein [Chitinophagaceae bacterium]
MKQILKKLFTVVFCAAIFSSCSKHTGKQITGANTPVNKGVSLNKGQKLQIDNSVKTVSTMEVMGQSMEINADVLTTHQLEVKDKKEKSYIISSTITKMNLNSSAMGQTMNYDSDKKEDNDSEMGKMMKDQINVPKEVELSDVGKVINIKKDSAKAAPALDNPIMGMISNMGGGQDESTGINQTFQVLTPGTKAGDTWNDSTVADGVKTYITYTVKGIEGNDATITLSGNQVINKTIDNQGMEANVVLESKLSGEILVDKSTGIVKQRTLILDGTGSADAMGQSIPVTTKVTSSSVVKSL